MKIKLIGICLTLLVSCETGHQEYSIEAFMNTTSIGGASFSPDEKSILIRSNQSGIYNAFEIYIDSGIKTQLTHSDSNSIFPISYFPKDKRFLYRGDQNGNEIWHIYVQNENGSTLDLTPGEKSRSLFSGWAYDEESFYYTSNQRNPKYMDIYEMNIHSFKSKMIYQNDDAFNFAEVSNDGRYLALNKSHTRDNSDMYLYDIQSRNLNHISNHKGNVNFNPSSFSVDSKSLYFLTDKDSEFKYLQKYIIADGNIIEVQKEEWDIWYSYFSHSGRYRVTGINADSQTEIEVFDQVMERSVRLPQLPAGSISSVSISKSEKYMAIYHGSAKSPSDLYLLDVESKKYQKLTNAMNPDVNPDYLGDAKVIRFKSFDGLEIPAVYYKPPNASSKNRVPAIVKVHGGPGGQARVGYRASTQYLVNHGYAVLDINNRGSRGYGKTFQTLDDQAHGEGDLDDCVWAMNWLKKQNHIDGDKIGILGGSYGGYMVMAALAFRPNAFDVGVNLFGVTNWVRTMKSIPPWWEAMRESLYKEMGNPHTQEAYLYGISPLFHAVNITKPVLVLQGTNDPRVLQVESDEMVEAVRAQGIPVEYVIFPDEGHGFAKKKNQIASNKAILNFLNQYLKGK
ncbi:MAG TPA: S9 family peptidase [Candidatus Marinimicrobia bacterium]|jgi:dipeptidyl aminopeptidase/acylaminoacyl peptidase|nr:S9 family peptidase [Candidatus Neomarinimicrobiota bacterium]